MPKYCISLNGGKKSFGDVEVLKGIDLRVTPGEVMCVLGPSGVGKSTLLRCLTTLSQFDEGTLTYGEDVVCEQINGKAKYVSKKDLAKVRENFGIVFQNFNLFPHYSVLKNVADPLYISKKYKKEEANLQALEKLKLLSIEDKANCYPCDLSGGQQQRVAIARSLILNPNVIYFDEPTSALDPRLTAEVAQLIRNISNTGIGIIVVTHDVDFAKNVSDSVALMNDGIFVEYGETNIILENPSSDFGKAFLDKR